MLNGVKTLLLLSLLTVLLVMAGNAVGGRQGMMAAFAIAVLMNGAAYWWSDAIVLRMHRARIVSAADAPDLHQIVRELASRARLPMPRLAVIRSEAANAFATGRSPERAVVAVTQGLLRQLGRDEIRAVLAHELAHVRHRDVLIASVAAVLAGAISMLAMLGRFSLFFGGHRHRNPIALLAAVLVMPLAALMVQMAISRSREYHADAAAARLTGSSRPLITALRRLEAAAVRVPLPANPATAHLFIVNPLRGGGLASLFSTHPPLAAARIARLEALPG